MSNYLYEKIIHTNNNNNSLVLGNDLNRDESLSNKSCCVHNICVCQYIYYIYIICI